MQRTLGAGAVGGQGAIVADLTGWREEKKETKGDGLGVNVTGSSRRVKESHLCTGCKMCLGISSEIYQSLCRNALFTALRDVMTGLEDPPWVVTTTPSQV